MQEERGGGSLSMTRHDKGGSGWGGDVVHDIMFGEKLGKTLKQKERK